MSLHYSACEHDVIDATVGEHLDLVAMVLLGLLGRHPVAVVNHVPVTPARGKNPTPMKFEVIVSKVNMEFAGCAKEMKRVNP